MNDACAPGSQLSPFGPGTHPAVSYQAQIVDLQQAANERQEESHV